MNALKSESGKESQVALSKLADAPAILKFDVEVFWFGDAVGL